MAESKLFREHWKKTLWPAVEELEKAAYANKTNIPILEKEGKLADAKFEKKNLKSFLRGIQKLKES